MLTCLILAVVVATPPASDPLPAEIGDAFASAKWSSLDWNHNNVATILPHITFAPKALGYIVAAGEARFFGAPIEVSILKRPLPVHPYGLSIAVNAGYSPLSPICRTVLSVLRAKLGSPSVIVELPSRRNGDVITGGTNFRAQWDIGVSRIGATCLAIDFATEQSVGVMYLRAGHRDVERADKPLVYLRCSQNLSGTIDGERREFSAQPDVMLIFDEHEKTILDEEFRELSKGVLATPTTIEFAIKRPNRTDEVRINRVTGQYKDARRVHGKPNDVVGATGSCERVDPKQAKF